MKFSELLIAAIERSEIPLRFEPGAEEAVAKPVTEMLRAWIGSRVPSQIRDDFDRGQASLARELLDELSDAREVVVE